MATLETLPDATTLLPAHGASGGRASLATRSVLYAVFKHQRLVVAIFLLVFVASTVATLIRPSMWRADTKVLVKLGETVQLAPAEAPSRSVYMPLNQDVVKTEAEIVKSRKVIEEAVSRVGVKPEPGVNLDEMIASMQLALTVMPLPGSNVLQISYLGRNPERAARMVNAITDVYLEHHNEVYQNEGLHTFYTNQLALLRTGMKKAQRRLRGFLAKKDIVDIDHEIQILAQELNEQEKSLRVHRGKMRSTDRKLGLIREQLAKTPKDIPYAEEYHANPVVLAFKNKLAELELERNRLRQQYMPTDRHVQDKEEEIANLQARAKRETERILGSETIRHNEMHTELMRHVMTLEVHQTDLVAREPGLAERVDLTRKRLHELRDERFRVNNLKQEAEEKAYAYDLYKKKQEEARITEAMKNQAMVNVSVVQRATRPLEPVNGMALPLVIGLVGGIGVAAAMAVGVEYMNRRLRFEEEVERFLDLPVLAVIPDLETTSAIARS